MEELRLYTLPGCYYCDKVLRFAKQNDILLEVVSTVDPKNKEYLASHGGKNQVPCLFMGDKPMYESSDIISYLKERFL